MLSKSHSVAGSGAYPGGVAKKKKKAPPRPPPPSALGNPSASPSRGPAQRSYSLDQGQGGRVKGPDLIDFSTPPESPEMSRKLMTPFQGGVPSKESEYSYRVGASIFYIISPLKNSVARKEPATNPFSPPRPSAQAMLASPAKQVGINKAQQFKPTIIRRPAESNNNNNHNNNVNNIVKSDPSVRSSSGSSDWSEYSQPARYGNVPTAAAPIAWDEPPAQHNKAPAPLKVVAPTIIKPAIAAKPSILPKPSLNKRNSPQETRNYYDEPPESDEEVSFVSPPMPSEPPPPPPTDVAVSDWVDSTVEEGAGGEYQQDAAGVEHYHHGSLDQVTDSDKAYAIALYDYLSDMEGDLPLQVGDLVYLTYKIDEEWLYGQCAGVEGMFPASYVNVVVPLPETGPTNVIAQPVVAAKEKVESKVPEQIFFADALYQFDAETDGDLSLRPGDMVKIFGRINEDWLYGEVAGKTGQFPSTFVDPVPSDLPVIEIPT